MHLDNYAGLVIYNSLESAKCFAEPQGPAIQSSRKIKTEKADTISKNEAC